MRNVISGKQFFNRELWIFRSEERQKDEEAEKIGGMGIEHGGGLWRRWKRGQ